MRFGRTEQRDSDLSDLYPSDCTCTIGWDGEQAYAENLPQYQIVALHIRGKTEELDRLAGSRSRLETQRPGTQKRIPGRKPQLLPGLP